MLRNLESYDWFTLSLILLLIGIILLKKYNVVKFLQFIKVGYSDIYWINKRKKGRYFSTFEVIIFLLPHLIISQILYLSIDNFNFKLLYEIYPLFNVLILFCFLCLFSFAKYYFEKLINICLGHIPALNFYLFYKQMVWAYAVLLGLPFLIISVYLPYKNFNIIPLSLYIMAGFYTFKIIGLAYKNRKKFTSHWYYIILYLCTLEIAPYFFLYKIFAVE